MTFNPDTDGFPDGDDLRDLPEEISYSDLLRLDGELGFEEDVNDGETRVFGPIPLSDKDVIDIPSILSVSEALILDEEDEEDPEEKIVSEAWERLLAENPEVRLHYDEGPPDSFRDYIFGVDDPELAQDADEEWGGVLSSKLEREIDEMVQEYQIAEDKLTQDEIDETEAHNLELLGADEDELVELDEDFDLDELIEEQDELDESDEDDED